MSKLSKVEEERVVEKYFGCDLKYLIITNGEIRADAPQMEADGLRVSPLGPFENGLLSNRAKNKKYIK